MTVSAIRIAAFSLLALVLTAASIELAGVLMGTSSLTGQEIGAMALALPALWSFLLLFCLSALAWRFGRFVLVTRAELLCVLFTVLLAAPLMSVGFWRFLIPSIATFPRSEDFVLFDTLNPKLWPHGPNLTEGILEEEGDARLETQGQVNWEALTLANGRKERVPVIEHLTDEAESIIRIHLPASSDAEAPLLHGQNYLLNVLTRSENLGLESLYFCRVYYGESRESEVEAFTAVKAGETTFIQREGFRRAGIYGLILPQSLENGLFIELGLKGSGRVIFRDLQFINTEALEGAYRGRPVIGESDFERFPESRREGHLVRPDDRLSMAGLRYLAGAYVPWGDWRGPLLVWGTYLGLILAGTFAIAVIMRREWIESQRFPLPLAQIPLFLFTGKTGFRQVGGRVRQVGTGDTAVASTRMPGIWAGGWLNRFMWTGLAVTFGWCILRGWHDFNATVPDLSVDLRLQPYFSDPNFGHMWSPVTFSVFAVFLGLAVFLELNVLASLVIGYFLYRAQYWFGEVHGLTHELAYPYVEHQQLTAYLVYAALLLFFLRKYLWRVLREALQGEVIRGEVLSSRGALLLLLFSAVGMGLWAHWVSLPVSGMLILYAALLSIGLVAMKLRAECGVPSYAFFPTALVLIVAVAGGMEVFGAQGTMFAVFISVILSTHAFFLIPGLQMEFLELGRTFGLKKRIIVLVNLLAVSGGFLIGGWFFLSGAYAKGIEWFPDSVDYRDITQATRNFNIMHDDAVRELHEEMIDRGEEETEEAKVGLGTWVTLYAGGLTALATVLRYIFAGFWFHPIGVILGPMPLMDHIWGSLLVAWLVRLAVLKLGGAVTVREKLLPFFAGVFLGGVMAKAVFFLINLHLHFFTSSNLFQRGLF